MPELPDITVYLDALDRFIGGRTIEGITVRSPFLVRTFEPPVEAAVGRPIQGFSRIGKRIVWELDGDLFLVFHLMIAGRFHWKEQATRPSRKVDLAAFDFDSGTLLLTEASSKKRAALSVIQDRSELAAFDRGGLDVLSCSLEDFGAVLTSENHTLKRSLTDPRLFDGIGNAYSDEILHAAGLSPIRLTSKLADEEIERLFDAVRTTLRHWMERLHAQTGDTFPEKVTAFREGMAVHGRFGKPCPVCATEVQRIRYADNETNYCPRCQTDGRLLADRSLSRLLRNDWPKTIEELEQP